MTFVTDNVIHVNWLRYGVVNVAFIDEREHLTMNPG
jgi:hypothetical protein